MSAVGLLLQVTFVGPFLLKLHFCSFPFCNLWRGWFTVPDGKKEKSNPPKIGFEIVSDKTTSACHTPSAGVTGIMSSGSMTQVLF